MTRNLQPSWDLQLGAKTIGYEFYMLEEAYSTAASTNGQVNALYRMSREALLLHIRTVASFLLATKNVRDDIQARHYVDNFTASLPEYVARKFDVDQNLAHPTYLRATNNMNYDYVTLRQEIVTEYNNFLARIANDDPPMRPHFVRP